MFLSLWRLTRDAREHFASTFRLISPFPQRAAHGRSLGNTLGLDLHSKREYHDLMTIEPWTYNTQLIQVIWV